MSKVPSDLKFTKNHEWVKLLDNKTVRVGLTEFAGESLGKIVFVELPREGTPLTAEARLGSLESVKSVTDIQSPVTGKVIAVNREAEDEPGLLNSDPYGKGWLVEIELDGHPDDALASLMQPAEYEQYTSGSGE